MNMGFIYDSIYKLEDQYPENFAKEDINAVLSAFCASYDATVEQQVWFDNLKAIAESLGFCSDMKAYKAAPENYKGSIADVSMFLRVAVTGKMNSPDLYEIMKIIGKERVLARINAVIGG